MNLKVVQTLRGLSMPGETAVALGFFDGVHLGHQSVINRIVSFKKEGYIPCVFSFLPSEGIKNRGKLYRQVISTEEKMRLLEELGVEYLFVPEFEEFREMQAEEFIYDVLQKRFRARVICTGLDFRFGKNAEGDALLLKSIGAMSNFKYIEEPAVLLDGKRISSTRIRRRLSMGDMRRVRALLGRYYSYNQVVEHGKELGRKISFPTINQSFFKNQIHPREGIYASAVVVDDKVYIGTTSIGRRITIEENMAVNSETYISGFSGDLYGKEVRVAPIQFLRGEERFDSIEALQAQIAMDVLQSEDFMLQFFADETFLY